ncbi:MAG: hypothetical protein SFU86_11900 [Pirellulaceae bacterium]|nr:hypothetical protein [Pirellulaceae bacterium]
MGHSCFRLRLIPLAALALFAGCGTGEYNRRFQVALTESGRAAVFDTNLDPSYRDVTDTAAAPTGVQLRLPTKFDQHAKALPPTEARAQPPFLKIPGFSYALERRWDDDAGQFAPLYCYIAAAPKGEDQPDALLTGVQTQVAATFPQAAWQDTTASSPTGGSIAVKKLTATGEQEFDIGEGAGPIEKKDGRFELFFYEGPAHYIFIGFRGPTGQWTKQQMDAAVQAAVGTIRAGGAPAPAAAAPADGQPMPADPSAPAAPATP